MHLFEQIDILHKKINYDVKMSLLFIEKDNLNDNLISLHNSDMQLQLKTVLEFTKSCLDKLDDSDIVRYKRRKTIK
ncbi:MAG: hypothetical protein EOP34_06830 [Rickettsiales bacterium]|nr:MAG: hypothetical protein EOP34_06830 [Rickettsiales bacterium]